MKHNKHQNQIRIIGGLHRGRKLAFPDAEGLRPTPDSVRERLFNWLGQDLTGQRVLDMFAGSGALGLEAASRHAAQVVLVERQRTVAQALHRHVRTLAVAAEVVEADALAFLQQRPAAFDGVFLDPPFAWRDWQTLWPLLAECLKEGAWVYVEAGRLPEWPPFLALQKSGQAGMSRYALLRCTQNPDAAL
ncbi:16S rRNA (guanine(966)-N(2))-methyltransferase RsmD [Neisseria sp. HSC-16F19]|nr:16S rRNA (guanine(966)-N(2))-methyltransferase RsmD [Neisseria sp. HSC-16F19]